MPSYNGKMERIETVAGLIARKSTRELFVKLCREISLFSSTVDAEIALFEVRFSGPGNFKVTLSSYRELFLVSVGEGNACDVRVSSKGAFLSALDLALHHFLETHSEMAS